MKMFSKSSDSPVRGPVGKVGGQLKAMGKMVGQRPGKAVAGRVIGGINKVKAGMNMAKDKMQKAKDMAGPRLKKLAAADDFEPTKGRF